MEHAGSPSIRRRSCTVAPVVVFLLGRELVLRVRDGPLRPVVTDRIGKQQHVRNRRGGRIQACPLR
jgi:hypothetical protein